MVKINTRLQLAFLGAFLLPALFILCQYFYSPSYLKSVNRVQGYFVESQTWDQFGKKIVFENLRNGQRFEKILPPNGFFVFENMALGEYRLAAVGTSVHVPNKIFSYSGGVLNLGILKYQAATPRKFSMISLIPLMVGVFYFVFALTLFLKIRHENLGLVFLILSLPPFWVNVMDSLQSVLAHTGFEFLAGRLFYLKHYPLIFCACGMMVFFLILAGHKEIVKKTQRGEAFFLPAVALSPIFISAFVFNAEPLFRQLWGFDYSVLVKFNVAFLFLSVLSGLFLLIKNYRQIKGATRRRAKTVLFSSLVFWAVYVPVVLIPVIFFDSRELFSGEFALFGSVGVLGLFMAFAKAVFGDHLVSFEAMSNRNFLYQTVGILYGGVYLILFFHMHPFIQLGWLQVAYLVFAILAFNPLQKLLFRFLDQLFAPPRKNVAQILASASQEILGTLDRDKLVSKIKKSLQNISPYLETKVYLRRRLELREFQLENQNQNLALNEQQENFIGDGKIKKLENLNIFQTLLPAGDFLNYYVVPFVINARLEGWAMIALPASTHPFGVDDYHLLQALQEQISIGILNSRLYEELKQTYQNYKESQEKLHKLSRLSMMGQLAAGFAHEIKNPLTSISTLVQAFPQNIDDKEFRNEFSEIVPRQIQRTMDLITKMLSYGQERDLVQEDISLVDLCTRNIRLLNQHAVKYGVRIEQEIIHPIVIKTDGALWDEVFLNLMLNGIQAMPQGGVLKVVFSKNKERFVIEVRDVGIGIPQEMLSKIFQPLFTTRKTGTGMGLAIVERNLARMDVEVQVHSQAGVGTTFTLMLPHRI